MMTIATLAAYASLTAFAADETKSDPKKKDLSIVQMSFWDKEAWLRGRYKVIPAPLLYRASDKALVFVQFSEAIFPPSLTVTIRSRDGGVVRSHPFPARKTSAPATRYMSLCVDLTGLLPGDYTYTLALSDLSSGRTIERTQPFLIADAAK